MSRPSIDWKRYYDAEGEHQRFLPGDDPALDKRLRFVRLMLGSRRYREILDVGCGDGYIADRLRSSRVAERVTGLDGSASRIQFARERFPELEILHGDFFSLPFEDSSKDLVTAIEVVEHLEDPAGAIAELARVSSRHVLVTVPFNQVLVDVLCPHCLQSFPLHGHIQSFDTERLQGLFERAGLRTIKVDISRWFLDRLWLRGLTWPLAWRLIPSFFRTADYLGVLGQKMR